MQVFVLCWQRYRNGKGGVLINQKIYKDFMDIHFAVAIYPISGKVKLRTSEKTGQFTDMTKWKFVGLSNKQITTLFKSLNTNKT